MKRGEWQKLFQPNCLSLPVLSSDDFLSVSTLASRPPSSASLWLCPVSVSVCNCSLCFFLSFPHPATYRCCIDQTRAQTHAHMHTHWASHPFHHWFALFCSAISFSLSLSPLSFTLTRSLTLYNGTCWFQPLEKRERRERNRKIMTGRQREALRQWEGDRGFEGYRARRRRILGEDR